MQAIKENLMGSSEGEVEDNLDDIDKADLDEFLMNKEGEKEEENKHRKLAEGKRKRGNDSKEDKVSLKRRRGPESEVSVFDQQLQTMSGVEVKDGVAAETVSAAVDNEGSPNGRQRKPKSLPCGHCGKTFAYISMLNKHIASHTKPLPCEFCTRRFSRNNHLKWHLSSAHSGEEGRAAKVFVYFFKR